MKFRSICAAIFVFFYTNAFANDSGIEDAKVFITNLSNDVISIIQNTKSSDKEKFESLKKKFLLHVDLDWISKFILGPHYKSLTENQKKEFTALYREFAIYSYVPKFSEFNQDVVNIIDARKISNTRYEIATIIDRKDEQDVKVVYMLAKATESQKLQIYDIVVEGVSMITTHRAEFASLVANKGYDYMIEQLKMRTEKIKLNNNL